MAALIAAPAKLLIDHDELPPCTGEEFTFHRLCKLCKIANIVKLRGLDFATMYTTSCFFTLIYLINPLAYFAYVTASDLWVKS